MATLETATQATNLWSHNGAQNQQNDVLTERKKGALLGYVSIVRGSIEKVSSNHK